jgi:Xaa-Pro aminopeptidase
MRRWLQGARAGALRLRGIDWFAWATAGGSGAAPHTADGGVAEVLVSAAEACILTDETAADRLRDEEVPPGLAFHVMPWEDPEWRERFVLESAGAAPVLSDRPLGAELPLPAHAHHQRLVLSEPEQQRYRRLGAADAAAAISEALRAARPDWSEYALAAEARARCGIAASSRRWCWRSAAAGWRCTGRRRRPPTPSARTPCWCCAGAATACTPT